MNIYIYMNTYIYEKHIYGIESIREYNAQLHGTKARALYRFRRNKHLVWRSEHCPQNETQRLEPQIKISRYKCINAYIYI